MNFEVNAEDYLDRIPMWSGKKHSIEDVALFLERLGKPEKSQRIIHVAGTNGKGSVCAYITSVLLKAGCRVGTFLSPHLWDIRERFLIDGRPVGREAFEKSFLKIYRLSQAMIKKGFGHPSYFEFLFYMGMVLFESEGVDFTVLETGLGGRLDATNAIPDPLVTVITSISLEHTEYLGDTIAKIAGEKAGIIKPGVPVVYEGQGPEASQVIEAKAHSLVCPVYRADENAYHIEDYGEAGIRAEFLRLDGSAWKALIPFQAEYQVKNGLTALRALEALALKVPEVSLTGQALFTGFRDMRWPGRMEEALPGFFLDGAHNPGGAREFARAAGRLCRDSKKRAFLLFAVSEDKAHEAMIQAISEMVPLDWVGVTALSSKKTVGAEILLRELEEFCGCSVTYYPFIDQALRGLLGRQDEDHLLFCTGSLYLIGEVRNALGL